MMIRILLALCFTALFTTSIHAQEREKEATSKKSAAPALECENTAVLWRIEYGEEHYAEAFCKAGCASYSGDDALLESDDLEECAKGVEHVTKTYYVNEEEGWMSCLDIKHDIQLIRAWHGRDFDGVAWKDYFKSHYSWYGKRKKTSYSPAAYKLRTRLEKMRAKCPKMSKDEKRYASALIATLKRGKFSGHQPIMSFDEFGSELAVFHGDDRQHSLLASYDRMESYAPRVYPEPQKFFADYTEAERAELPEQIRDLTYKAVISTGGTRISPYCNHFNGDEDCGSGGRYSDYYLNERAEIVAVNNTFMACPFVYTRDEDEAWHYQGEILRNLRRPDMEGWQTLDVRVTEEECEGGVIQVRLTEEKREVTSLDAVSLQVGEHMIAPVQCRGEAIQAMCEDDGRYHVIEQGEELLLEFVLPEQAIEACMTRQITLHADGYYVPVWS